MEKGHQRDAESAIRDTMSYSLFYDSVFQLAAEVAELLDVNEYVNVLTGMLEALVDAGSDCPSHSWRSQNTKASSKAYWERVRDYLKLEAAKEAFRDRRPRTSNSHCRSPAPESAQIADGESAVNIRKKLINFDKKREREKGKWAQASIPSECSQYPSCPMLYKYTWYSKCSHRVLG